MIKKLTEQQQNIVNQVFDSMSLAEKIGQVQCVNAGKMSRENLENLINNFHIGSIFVGNVDKERLKEVYEIAKCSKYPIIINGDFVNGVGSRIEGLTEFPQQLACSASDDENLIEKMGEITAKEGRAFGAQWTFGPVIDLCFSKHNPMMHIRTAGDRKEQVLKIGKAFIDGVQKDGLMAATAKHFPGDGLDDRDTHITTLINSLSLEEWMNSYGYIWKGVINSGVMSIMSGHIALPCVDPEYENEWERYKGPRPATLSKKILTGFLREKLGFEGLIVTDAVNMIGMGAHLKREDYGVKLLNAGNDMLLWTKPQLDSPQIEKGIENNLMSIERLNDAVIKVLELKARVGLFNQATCVELEENFLCNHAEIAQQVADKSIVVYRDVFNVLPLKNLKKGDKVLTVTLTFEEGIRNGRDAKDLVAVDEELTRRGFEVDHLVNPDESVNMSELRDKYKMVFINFKYPAKYGTIRLMGKAIFAMKTSWWVESEKVVFTSFGDPFKIYDLPALQNYVCAFSVRESSQRAAVKTWFGENKISGVSPINMERFLKYQWEKF